MSLIVAHDHSNCTICHYQGVSNRWTGLLDWTTGLDYWTAIILCTANDNDVKIWPSAGSTIADTLRCVASTNTSKVCPSNGDVRLEKCTALLATIG